MQVTTSESGEKDARTITTELAADDKKIKGNVDLYGEEIVVNYFVAQLKVAHQAFVRRMLKDGKSDKEIFEALEGWEPSMKKPGKSPVEKAKDAWTKLSPEDQKALLQSLKG